MYSIHKISVIILIIVGCLPAYSQEKVELPMSIFSPKTHFPFFDKKTNIPYDLKLIGHPFVLVDIEDIKSNLFTISFNNIGKTPTDFVFESYQQIIFNETEKYYDPNKIAILPTFKRLN